MSADICCKCSRMFAVGDHAWADEWKVLDVQGNDAVWRTETRYTCDPCHDLGVAS